MVYENHDRNTHFSNNMNAVIPKPNVEAFRNYLCTKLPFHATACYLTLKMLPRIIVLKECTRKSILCTLFIVPQDHI